ncbi:TPA_asm: N [Justicia betacytorhabdovirus 1]|nr:TPA_asm: N [Justicia betacytorhabdovirus 1]
MADFEKSLLNKYKIDKPISLSVISSKEFSDISASQFPAWEVDATVVRDIDLISLSNQFYDIIEGGFNSPNSAKLTLFLALQIRSSKDTSIRILSAPSECKWESLTMPSIGASRDNRGAETDTTEDQIDKAIESGITNKKTKAQKKKDKKKGIELHESTSQGNQMDITALIDEAMGETRKDITISSAADQTNLPFGPFLAAYLMKLLVKPVTNVLLGVENMRRRYLSFYPEVGEVTVNLEKEGLERLRARLASDHKILASWIYHTAYYEYKTNATEVDAGIVRFLANLQFSFNGMTAYGLFRELLIATGEDPAEWLVKLWTSQTKRAIQVIFKILNEHESIIIEDKTEKRSWLFKYARLLDPQYFLDIQPSQCVSLIYLMVKCLGHYKSYSALANPEKIAVLTRLGVSQKEYLDSHAEILTESAEEVSGETTRYVSKAMERYKSKKTEDNSDEIQKKIKEALNI